VHRIDKDPTLRAKLHAALVRIRHVKTSSLQANTAQSDLQVTVFSDSIVISGARENLFGVIWSVIHLQSSLLDLGILIRGGIACGRTFHENDILYGEGMLAAYDLESKAAVYPRVVLHPQLIPDLGEGYRAMLLSSDMDGFWFLDPFSIGILPGDSEELLEDGWDPHEVALKRLGKRIDAVISELTDPGQLAKWNWLKVRHKLASVEFEKLGMSRFSYIWSRQRNRTNRQAVRRTRQVFELFQRDCLKQLFPAIRWLLVDDAVQAWNLNQQPGCPKATTKRCSI
jgi:hypothetical protein